MTHANPPFPPEDQTQPTLARLRAGLPAVWLRPPDARNTDSTPITTEEIATARARLDRFRPVLAALFPASGWDGRIRSPLLEYPQ